MPAQHEPVNNASGFWTLESKTGTLLASPNSSGHLHAITADEMATHSHTIKAGNGLITNGNVIQQVPGNHVQQVDSQKIFGGGGDLLGTWPQATGGQQPADMPDAGEPDPHKWRLGRKVVRKPRSAN